MKNINSSLKKAEKEYNDKGYESICHYVVDKGGMISTYVELISPDGELIVLVHHSQL